MTMRAGFAPVKGKRQLKSILLICMLVASSMLVVFPLSVPKARAQVVHLATAALEDIAGLPYDTTPKGDGVVRWDPDEDHIINNSNGYTIEAGMTLDIPPLSYFSGDPDEHEITFQGSGSRIDVYGTLRTNSDGEPNTITAFLGEGFGGFDGIYFHSGSEGRIVDTLIKKAQNGVVFEPGSTLTGVGSSYFKDIGACGMRLDGVLGNPSMSYVQFLDGSNPTAIGLDVANGNLDMFNVFFHSHGPGLPSLRISNASVNVKECQFNGDDQPGNTVLIERNSNGTKLDRCLFIHGAVGDHYVQVDGSSNLIVNSKFVTSGGSRTVIANENALGIPSHPVLLNPTGEEGDMGSWDDSFDNSTMNVTGSSSITLQWYMDVQVKDPNGNPIDNAPVWVNDRIGNPAAPPSKITDASGRVGGFIVTELIQYNNSVTNFNLFEVSALNNSIIGYAYPTMNMSKVVTVIVPFNPVPNLLPIVSFIQTPSGVQSGPVSIQYRLEDLDIGDDGNLSITVEFWDPIASAWKPATAHPSSGPTTYLHNNTLYTFVWDSKFDFQDKYGTDVKIKIIPYDKGGPGISSETLNFTVDNEPPILLSGPTVETTNTTAFINWTVHEPANASVRYGFDGLLTNMVIGSTSTTFQTVTLTGLRQGRRYTYTISSIDQYGNRLSSALYAFDTKVHIQLYKGWNMISIPPHILDPSLKEVLAPIKGQYDAVQSYNTSDLSDPWKHYKVGKPYGNDLSEINETMGFWIHMKSDTVFVPDQVVPHQDYSGFIPLVKGWNFVGYPSAQTRLVDDALAGVTYDVVLTYDAGTGQWLSYDGSSGSLTKMEIGRGYWIHCSDVTLWQVDYV